MEKIWAALGTFLLVGFIAGYVFERDQFQNLLDLKRLLFIGFLAGFLAAALLIFLVRKSSKHGQRVWPSAF